MGEYEERVQAALTKMVEGVQNATALASGGLIVALHTVRVLANRGLISPNEVETIYTAMTETIERLGSPALESNSTVNIGPMFAEIRQCAEERWIGKGEPDPEPRPGHNG
jgi:hypothetical protein